MGSLLYDSPRQGGSASESATTGLIFLLVGGVSALVAVLLFLRSRRFLGSAVSVQGMVTDLVARSGSEGGVVYAPVVQFTTVEGQTHTFTDSVGSSPPKYAAGATVKVMYPPGNPEGARIPSWFRMWFLPSFSTLFAVIFLGAGFFIYTTASDAEDTLTGVPIPEVVASLLPSGAPGIPGTPGVLPPAGDAVLVIARGGDAPQIVSVTCDGVRELKGGRVREVRLSFPDGTLTFRASPYTGPGPYTPGANVEVGGNVFERTAELTGAVVFDESEEAGTVNLVAGPISASGAWDCKGTG